MKKYHVGSPRLPSEEGFNWILKQMGEMLTTRRLTNDGPYVRRLEREMARFLEVNHCVAVTNATIGLMILAKALNLSGEVIMPSLSFVATASAFEWIGLKPVFADVTKRHHLDPCDVERKITDKTSAIVGVHLWGNACNVSGLHQVAEDYGVKLLFDAAQAMGTRHDLKAIGGFGAAEVFSLHATKIINSLEGGIIATNYADLADKCRQMRNFGFAYYDTVVYSGINGKMSELAAIFGLEGLRGFEDARRDALIRYNRYKRNLADVGIIEFYEHDQGSNYHYVVTMIKKGRCKAAHKALWNKGILARRYYYPGIHRISCMTDERVILPETEKLLSEILVLPSGGGDHARRCRSNLRNHS